MPKTQYRFPDDPVMIRLASAEDAPALELLAELDSARLPVGPTLLAERGGEPVAALALADGLAVANPFRPSGDVLALLRLRALQIAGSPARLPQEGERAGRRERAKAVHTARLLARLPLHSG